jgi:thiol:disulfide interchange protein DsbD
VIERLAVAALAGAATSLGPCVAPRYLALAALIGGRRPLVPTAAFTAGIVVAYVVLGTGAGLVATLASAATAVDLVLAAALIAAGAATILREPHACDHRAAGAFSPAGGAFALGAGSALVISPCCTPLLAAFAGLGAFQREPGWACATLAAFALGHAAPLALTAMLGSTPVRRLRALTATGAPAVVSGTLMIALGGWYGLLA